jgi:hypothetical protein
MSTLPTATPQAIVDEIEHTSDAAAVLETQSPLSDVEAPPAPTLITEQEVVFGTAAAVRPPSTTWWARAARVLAAPTRVFVTTAADSQPKRRHYPPRLDFLDDSRMDREMYRL